MNYINAFVVMFIIGAILGLLLSIASNLFYVKEDPRTEEVTKMLPGYNCGSCGYSGCGGLANALVKKETDLIVCKPSKPEKKDEIIKYLAQTPGPDGETISVRSA